MKILICGIGSIGSRHAKNLIKLGYSDILLNTSRKILDPQLKKLKIYKSLKKALLEKPNLALICNETYLHEDSAIECLKNNVNIFIEKPIGFNKRKLKILYNLINKKKKINNMVGYMMRFHPAISRIKKLLKKKEIGEIFHFSTYWGEYLPNWHKNENYKNSYAAIKTKGGGVSLTLSHDLDLACHLFGKIKKIELFKNKINTLKIKAESAVDFFVVFKKNISGLIHLDYLQKKPDRTITIIGTEGKIKFDYYKNKLEVIKKNKSKFIYFKNFKRNELFINEIKYVIKRVKNKNKMEPNIINSIKLLKNFKLI